MATLTFGAGTQTSSMDDGIYQAGQNRSVSQDDDLVGYLKSRLMLSRSKLHAWVEEQKAVCDATTSRYRADRTTYQDQIEAKAQSILSWKMEKGLNLTETEDSQTTSDSDKEQIEATMQESIQRLQEKVKLQKDELEGLKLEKMAKEEAAGDAQPLDEPNNPTKEQFDELQTIVKGYQDISGLSFEKAENERLRFFFKGLDKKDRSRQCTFLLSTSPDDLYLVENCQPAIPEEQLTVLVERLNDSEDLGSFFQAIRSVWSTSFLEDETDSD